MAVSEIHRGIYSRVGSNKRHFNIEQNHLQKLQWNWTSFQTQSIYENDHFKVAEKILSAEGKGEECSYS